MKGEAVATASVTHPSTVWVHPNDWSDGAGESLSLEGFGTVGVYVLLPGFDQRIALF